MAETMVPEAGASVDEPRGDDDIILRMDAVVGGYGSTTVLHETSFEVYRNALTTIIGPNGAGKSTAIKAIFGMLRVRSGHVWYDDDDIVGLEPGRVAAAGHQLRPPGSQRVPEDVGAGQPRARRGEPRQPVAHPPNGSPASPSSCSRCLRDKADRQAGTLSGGEQKMLEIGRAMLLEPRLLLIDEPSVGLSPILVQQVFRVLQRAPRPGDDGADDRAERQSRRSR